MTFLRKASFVLSTLLILSARSAVADSVNPLKPATPATPVSSTGTATISITLKWTAPGDDGMTGRATRYDLRYSILPITPTNFNSAVAATGLPTPAVSGTQQQVTVTGLDATASYFFAMKTVDEAGNWSTMSNVVTRAGQSVGIGDPQLVLSFSNPYPNPARQSATMSFTLPQAAMIQVDAFDIAGRHIRTLASGQHDAGRGEVNWDLRDDTGRTLEAGVYLVRGRLAGQSWTRRVVIVR